MQPASLVLKHSSIWFVVKRVRYMRNYLSSTPPNQETEQQTHYEINTKQSRKRSRTNRRRSEAERKMEH